MASRVHMSGRIQDLFSHSEQKANMIKFNVYLESEQLEKLRVIGRLSIGKPDVSSLIREAIDEFIVSLSNKNSIVKRALEPDHLRPRLISRSQVSTAGMTGAGQDPPVSGGN